MQRRQPERLLSVIAVIVFMSVGALALCMRSNMKRGPVHGGRSLSNWLDDRIVTPAGPHVLTPRAVAAVREIGPSAIPTLLEWVKQGDQRFMEQLRYGFGVPVPLNQDWRTRGFHGFRALGDMIDVAIPDLLELAMHSENDGVRRAAINSLTEDRPLTSLLLIEALRDPNATRRARAANVLGYLRPDNAMLPLAKALTDADPNVRLETLKALRFYKSTLLSIDTLNAIRQCTSDSAPNVRSAAVATLDAQLRDADAFRKQPKPPNNPMSPSGGLGID